MTETLIRPARTSDVRAIRAFIDAYSPDGRLLSKATVTLFEDIQEFLVAERDGEVVGCGALHVMWEDLAEVRTVAVDPALAGQGIGSLLLTALVQRAREVVEIPREARQLVVTMHVEPRGVSALRQRRGARRQRQAGTS